ncbi:hypothetical protein DENSPDRAFT_834947 [Dentipellis sp. KUC8613]|nr:hypothetical protein DENSPDRAFT_834947 [Dentipellis sp. KUC8613]
MHSTTYRGSHYRYLVVDQRGVQCHVPNAKYQVSRIESRKSFICQVSHIDPSIEYRVSSIEYREPRVDNREWRIVMSSISSAVRVPVPAPIPPSE